MRILIFGGTTEGRRLAERLLANSMDVTLCVATEYGKNAVSENPALTVSARRLDKEQMAELMRTGRFDYVVDATHPYAGNVTRNIREACAETDTGYLRLLRDKSGGGSSVIYAAGAAEAAELLEGTEGNVLLAVGSKELEAFTAVTGYSERMFVRVIPMPDSLEKALRLGYKNSNIICMQGPFDVDMNLATLKMTTASYMVTKDSGETGGFSQKLTAAGLAGCKVIVISRPEEEEGYDFAGILRFLNAGDEVEENPEGRFTYFPLYINLQNRRITVIGGGKIAERRIKALLPCGAVLTVVSPRLTEPLLRLAQGGAIRHAERDFQTGDTSGCFLVVAATNDRRVNRAVREEADRNGVLAVISDNRNECDCYFPAIAENDAFICGAVSKNGDHAGVAELAENLRRLLNDEENR